MHSAMPAESSLAPNNTGTAKSRWTSIPILIFLLTALYLAVELAFNAHLLDVVGNAPTESEIEAVEFYGRLLSGLAMALAVFPLVIKFVKRLPFGVKEILPGLPIVALALMVPVTAATIGFANYLQEEIVHRIETSSSADSRRTANLLLLINDGLRSNAITFDGLDLSEDKRELPETKAFFALLPALYLSLDDAFGQLSPNTRTILSQRIVSEVEADDLYEKYLEASRTASSLYVDYVEAQAEIPELKAQVDFATENIATEVNWFLNRAGVAGRSCKANAMYSNAVRGLLLRKRDIKLPEDWTLCDMGMIRQQIRSQLLANAETEISSKIQSTVGFTLPLGLSKEEFLSHPKILAKSCNEGPSELDCDKFAFGYSSAEFHTTFVEPLVQNRISEGVNHYLSEQTTFDTGAENHDAGYSAIRIAYVPLVAFVFSLAGIWLHLVKASYYAVLSLTLPRLLGVIAAAGMLTLLTSALLVRSAPNHILASTHYQELLSKNLISTDPKLAHASTTIIQWQPTLYPPGNALNEKFGWRFGS